MKRVYIGLELGSSQCEYWAMDHEATLLKRQVFKTSEVNLRKAFSELCDQFHKAELHIHMEACDLAGCAREVILSLVTRVVVSDPRQNSWISKDPNKRDKIDAFKLADLLRLNRFSEVFYSNDKSRLLYKQVVQHYEDITHQKAALKVKIKARLRSQELIRKDYKIFSDDGRKAIVGSIESQYIKATIKQLYELLEEAGKQHKQAMKTMRDMSKGFPEIALLSTLPGVKLINACRFSAYVQTPYRFSNVKDLWRYARLGVAQQFSDGKPIGPPPFG